MVKVLTGILFVDKLSGDDEERKPAGLEKEV
jgi:hypothetical protein